SHSVNMNTSRTESLLERLANREEVENQANTIAAQMAKAEKGNYRMLHVPDPLSETLYQTLLHEPMVKETLPIIKNASFVLHGIGDAITMATRRKASQE